MKQLTVVVIGAGSRGNCYTDSIKFMPEKFKVVGVAEPIESRREYLRTTQNIDKSKCFHTWEDLLSIPKFADIAIVSTMDQMHLEPALKALEAGYDLLLEKPAAPTAEECAAIYKKAKECGRKILVCHVLRYTNFFRSIKKLIDDGFLGEVISIEHTEAVGNIHQSHSYVRGLWKDSKTSSFMLLAKCCHDIDILQWLLNKECKKVQSFGSLSYFTEKNAPEGAPERCTDGCPHADACYYNAIKLYYDDKENNWFREAATKIPHPTDEQVMTALKTTDYGKCVFKCNNNVVDHQTVNMEFEGGTTATLTMAAFNRGGRYIRIMGTKGELFADMRANEETAFNFYDFSTREFRYLKVDLPIQDDSIVSGHGGGDSGIMLSLYDYVTGAIGAEDLSEIGISCKNHLITFAAEESRLTDKVIDVTEYQKRYMQ